MIKKKQSRTCIAAIIHKKKLYIAADRRASWDFSQAQSMPRPKIVKRDGLILAGTGDSYLCTLIVDRLKIPDFTANTIDDYMFENIHNSVLNLLLRKGYSYEHKSLNIPRDSYCEILVGISGNLYNIVVHNPDHLSDIPAGEIMIDHLSLPYATGCGGALAWGSLLTTEGTDMKPKERLIVALQVAAQVSPGCDDKIDIEHE